MVRFCQAAVVCLNRLLGACVASDMQTWVCLRLSRGHGISEDPCAVVYFGPDHPIIFVKRLKWPFRGLCFVLRCCKNAFRLVMGQLVTKRWSLWLLTVGLTSQYKETQLKPRCRVVFMQNPRGFVFLCSSGAKLGQKGPPDKN